MSDVWKDRFAAGSLPSFIGLLFFVFGFTYVHTTDDAYAWLSEMVILSHILGLLVVIIAMMLKTKMEKTWTALLLDVLMALVVFVVVQSTLQLVVYVYPRATFVFAGFILILLGCVIYGWESKTNKKNEAEC